MEISSAESLSISFATASEVVSEPSVSSSSSSSRLSASSPNQASSTAFSTMDHAFATAAVEDEEDVCRICRIPGDTDNPLRYPCTCRGSIKFVHQDCLLQWLNHRKARHCEVCKHPFSFSPVYAENAPTRLPFQEFVVAIATKFFRVLHFFLRLCYVISTRFIIIPYITFWICRLAFVRSFGEAQRLFLSHISTTVILTDCLHGFLLSATIYFFYFGVILLKVIFRRLRELRGQEEREDEGDRDGARAARRPPAGQANRNLAGEENGEDVGDQGAAFGQIVNRNPENVLERLGIQAVHIEAQVDQGFDGLDEADGAEEAIPSLLKQFSAAMKHLMTMVKATFFLVFLLGVFPLMCGWSLDVCTVKMFGKTMSHRVQFLSTSPLVSSLLHWVVGFMYIMFTTSFQSLLREVLRPGVLYFLDYFDDPNVNPFQDMIDDPVRKQARKVMLEVAMYGSLIVMLVFLPVKLAIRMAPSIFPLDISVSDPFTEIPADMLLLQICIPFGIKHFRLRTSIKSLLRYWFTGVGWALRLTDFLLPRPEDNIGQDNGNGEPGRQNRVQVLQVSGADRPMAALPAANDPNRSLCRAGNVNTGEEYEDDEEQSDSEYNFVVRIILLLLVAWVTLLIFSSALIVVPVSLGRALFSAIPLLPTTHGIKCNDLYAFVIGTYAFWTTISGATYAIGYVKSKRTSVLLNQTLKWCGIVFKSSMLLAIWAFIIPVLIGLLFELLVIVPMRVPVDESPVFLLYQDWALGLIFFKIWTRLVMLDYMLPIVDDSWRAKFERVREDGFSRLQGLWVLREIVFPIVMKLLTALCVPYVLARGVFPMLGYPLVVNSAVYRFAWIGCLSVILFCFWFRNLHNSIRDDRYLIGRRLHNFGEDALSNPKPK
ncbi:Zinc finger RING-CH-type [Arabidopsis thaliana x Arabidopsis arenosa]|uniref:RING-type E3 ubiquitin transferase n=1 Tax=Arabidopsis thaliana x Arabidopsis arenosa TaxID=1240361 RepID=A0A8T1Y226_9BRAS|nr:Zinc finger RING-CH-type [Arabidopsis thaliana x Arabidopsis arenosa]